jgi:hypothetical protein
MALGDIFRCPRLRFRDRLVQFTKLLGLSSASFPQYVIASGHEAPSSYQIHKDYSDQQNRSNTDQMPF